MFVLDIDPSEMKDDQRLAMALLAGCEVIPEWRDQQLFMTTRYPVGIQRVDGKYIVQELRDQRKGDVVRIAA